MDARDLASQLRGDRRIAVAVAADPRAPLQEGGHARRPRPAQAGVGGEPAGAVAPTPDPRPVHGPIEGAVDPRHRPEERLVEEGQGRANLVDRARGGLANRGGPPQQADLLAQPAPDLGVVLGSEARIVELFEEPVAAPQGGQHRAPPGLGGVGRQDRRDPQPPQQLLDPIGRPVALAEPVDGRVRESLPRAGRLPGSLELANLVALLAQVDELEVQAERVGQRLGLVDRKRVELGRESLVGALRRLSPGRRSSEGGSVRPARAVAGPPCSAITWPSRAPSSFTSRESGSPAPPVPAARGSASTAASPAAGAFDRVGERRLAGMSREHTAADDRDASPADRGLRAGLSDGPDGTNRGTKDSS